MQQLGKKPIPPIIRNLTGAIGMQVFKQFMQPRLAEQVEFIEAHLTNNEYFAGDFSFADVQMVFALLGLQEIPKRYGDHRPPVRSRAKLLALSAKRLKPSPIRSHSTGCVGIYGWFHELQRALGWVR